MDVANIAYRYTLLLEELKRRMTMSCKWAGLPGLLDELHSLRCQYEAAASRRTDLAAGPVDLL